jgi:regulatory protein
VRRRFNARGAVRQEGRGEGAPGGDAKAVEIAAVRLLARREHSTGELERKLLGKGYAAELVEPVVEKLAGKRLVSDERFVASFVHHHARRGQGPVRIRAELNRQGIPDEQIDPEIDRPERDWRRLACEVRQRKFGATPPASPGERAKQARFLQYRGFDADQIRAALSFDPDLTLDPDGGCPGVSDPDPADTDL